MEGIYNFDENKFAGVYGDKITSLGPEGFVRDLGGSGELTEVVLSRIEKIKSYINEHLVILNAIEEFAAMSFEDIFMECMRNTFYVMDTFGYGGNLFDFSNGSIWFGEDWDKMRGKPLSSLDSDIRGRIKVVSFLFQMIRRMGEEIDEVILSVDETL